MSAPGVPGRRGWYAPTVLLGLVGAALAAVAGSRAWATAAGSATAVTGDAAAKGSDVAPLGTALALVALAGWGVVLVARGRVRRLVAVIGASASVGVLLAVGYARDRAPAAALEEQVGGSPGDLGPATLTAWYYLTAVGAVLSLVAFLVAVVLAPGWPAMGSRYDAPAARADQPATEQDMWRALDEVHDPTS